MNLYGRLLIWQSKEFALFRNLFITVDGFHPIIPFWQLNTTRCTRIFQELGYKEIFGNLESVTRITFGNLCIVVRLKNTREKSSKTYRNLLEFNKFYLWIWAERRCWITGKTINNNEVYTAKRRFRCTICTLILFIRHGMIWGVNWVAVCVNYVEI